MFAKAALRRKFMNQTKEEIKREKKKLKRKKKNASVKCSNGREFWTTQDQFWQWVRDRVVVQTGNNPLSGEFVRENEELAVVIANTVLNLGHPNHLREALRSRKLRSS